MPYSKMIDNNKNVYIAQWVDLFPIYQQEHKYSCGLACLRMILGFLGQDLSEEQLRRKTFTPFWLWGIPPLFITYSAKSLLRQHGYTFVIKRNLTYEKIVSLLSKGLPLMHVYMSPRHHNPHIQPAKKWYSAHYVILLSIDEERKQVTIINPYGYKEEISLSVWRERISLSWKYLSQKRTKLARFLGLMKPRSFFIIKPIGRV